MAETPTLAHRAEYLALRGFISTLGALPWERAVAIGSTLGALGYRPLGIRRLVVERQIAAAFPGKTRPEVERIARASYEHLGRITTETALLPSLGREQVVALFEGADGWELVEEAMKAERGLLFVTGHLGNWELAGSYIAARGVPLDAVARRMNNPLFDTYLTQTRLRIGMTVVYDHEAVRRTARAVQAGRAVAFLVDQGVKNLASTFVPFFGRPAKTPRGPAVFALRWNVPLVFGAALRQPSGKYRLTLERIPVHSTGDLERDVDRVVAAYTDTLERWVRRAPEQYFWHHRRWKRQPMNTPVALRDPV
ncbi:MAG TPA: lysophospholipid acyltransferase family protein [Gemmatimonadaceae bacterium]|nr:lysophospholipid acyltransferase family protein [Gemmatimonadaceae bacterium]